MTVFYVNSADALRYARCTHVLAISHIIVTIIYKRYTVPEYVLQYNIGDTFYPHCFHISHDSQNKQKNHQPIDL